MYEITLRAHAETESSDGKYLEISVWKVSPFVRLRHIERSFTIHSQMIEGIVTHIVS